MTKVKWFNFISHTFLGSIWDSKVAKERESHYIKDLSKSQTQGCGVQDLGITCYTYSFTQWFLKLLQGGEKVALSLDC